MNFKNIPLNKSCVKEENKKEIRRDFELNESENTTYQYLCDRFKWCLEKIGNTGKKRNVSNQYLEIQLKKVEKKEQIKFKKNKRAKISKTQNIK